MRYYLVYRAIAVRIGVSLASEQNKAKAFGPITSGEVLDLNYDTLAWTTWIPEDKSTRLIREILKVIEDGEASNAQWTLQQSSNSARSVPREEEECSG